MEATDETKTDSQTGSESWRAFSSDVEALRQRPSVSVFLIPYSSAKKPQAGGRAANAKQDQPKASEAQLTGEKGSDARKAFIPDDKGWCEPSTASTSLPASLQRANKREPRVRFSARRGRGRKHGSASAPSEALTLKGYNSTPPALDGASSLTSVPRQKSRSLPLPDGTAAGTSSRAEESQLQEQLVGHNAVKCGRMSRSADQVPQPNRGLCSTLDQTPRQSSTFRQPQDRRQLLLESPCERRILQIMLPQGHEEAHKICFVLSEVAKAFHCKVDMCVAFQAVDDCGGMVYLPVGPSTYTPLVSTSDACPSPHSHAHGSQAEGKAPRRVIQKGTRNTAPRESQRANKKEVLQTLYPEVILDESPAEFISEEAANMQDEC